MNATDEFSFLLRPSLVVPGGIGVFSACYITKGARLVLSKFPLTLRRLLKSEIPNAFLQFCIARENDEYICPQTFLHLELVWYLNHSNSPNAALSNFGYHSLKDIELGEEILIDYNVFSEPEATKDHFYFNSTC